MLPQRIHTVTEFHRLMGLHDPDHPLISLIDTGSLRRPGNKERESFVYDFYVVILKKNPRVKLKFGRLECDFDGGVLLFMAPDQLLTLESRESDPSKPTSGWLLLVHPDYLWGTSLAQAIKRYEFFDYAASEALFLSDKEEASLVGIFLNIQLEYRSGIDNYSQNIIIAQLELLLSYSGRFYHRQFITRKVPHHQILDRLEELLAARLQNEALPTVQSLADQLNISPNYLSSLLKVLTGQTAQQHIQEKIIDKAKEMLSTTDLSVNEIAYRLGFGYPQSFTRLFKLKTDVSPSEFRQAFR